MHTFKKAAGIIIILLVVLWLYHSAGYKADAEPVIKQAVEPTGLTGLDIGDTAPELVFESPEGTIFALSSLRGSMVLVDFWASWCGPCRRGNPFKVSAWKNFREREFEGGKGFTLFSVSLDKNKDSWLKGIEDDNLEWETHVSDLRGWKSEPAAIYRVKRIPSSFLINGDGTIIAKNLSGELITEALHQYLKK